MIDKQEEFAAKKSKTVSEEEEPVNNGSADLLKLARAQGMNSDIRRGIFVVLMSSDVSNFILFTYLSCKL